MTWNEIKTSLRLHSSRLLSRFGARRVAFAVAGVGLFVVLLLLMVTQFRDPARAKLAHVEPPRLSVSAWNVEWLGGTESAFGVPQARPAAPLFIPPNADFALQAQPAGVNGEFADGAASNSWIQYGGRINPSLPTPLGTRQIFHAPSQPGLYRMVWTESAVAAINVAWNAAGQYNDRPESAVALARTDVGHPGLALASRI